jgi:hypothetical protein
MLLHIYVMSSLLLCNGLLLHTKSPLAAAVCLYPPREDDKVGQQAKCFSEQIIQKNTN